MDLVKPLEEPPEVPEGDDQVAAEGAEDTEVVTVVDLEDAPELDEVDYEPDA